MNIDFGRLSDQELVALIANARNECQRRVDDENQSTREPRLASILAMEGRRVMRGWTGYAAASREADGTIHIQQPDRDSRIVELWLRCPKSYKEDDIVELQRILVAALANRVRP